MSDGARLACVTGATRGVGLVIARALADAGIGVILVGRDADAGRKAAAEVAAEGGRAVACTADLSRPGALAAGLGEAAIDPAAIDILVCAAGVSLPHKPIWQYDETDYRRCFDLNVFGVMAAINTVLPGMIDRRRGSIVAIGGTYGHRGVAQSSLYAASKWALRGLIKSVAAEAGPFGVTANVVAPGGIDGDNLRAQFAESARREGLTPEAVHDRFAARAAMRALVTGADVAAAVLYAVSSPRVTGQDLLVDAGTIL
ncbi:SDR family oxidoreductase [Acetobacteraceae bacterium KSS8]|uniref:SDR family oxidoreductase n=1 Tax=Endosaccharibacter trunci TaxID=2812733 RepID=A0ABT1WB48_9PROT|nr:SDR family oxidoreductase [Acetobacteraceae bacterium KSS8]